MSTNDVPGANPANNDTLRALCWAEHKDGSLIVVMSTENDRVIYSVFDMSQDPIVEYRDAMPEADFKKQFSWQGSGDRWTWHDKTPFPWNKVIKEGGKDGLRHVSAEDQINAAQRVARSRKLMSQDFKPEEHEHMLEQQKVRGVGGTVLNILQKALDDLGKAFGAKKGNDKH